MPDLSSSRSQPIPIRGDAGVTAGAFAASSSAPPLPMPQEDLLQYASFLAREMGYQPLVARNLNVEWYQQQVACSDEDGFRLRQAVIARCRCVAGGFEGRRVLGIPSGMLRESELIEGLAFLIVMLMLIVGGSWFFHGIGYDAHVPTDPDFSQSAPASPDGNGPR